MEKHLKLALQFGVVIIVLLSAWYGVIWALLGGAGGEGSLAYLNIVFYFFVLVGLPVLGIHLVWSLSLLIISLQQIIRKRFLVQKKALSLLLSIFVLEVVICIYLTSLLFLNFL